MPISLGSIHVVRINELLQDLDTANFELLQEVSFEMEACAVNIVKIAKQRASKDMGVLARGITYVKKSSFNFSIISASQYSAFEEFGTSGISGSSVSVPAGFEQFAGQFKGIKPDTGGMSLAKAIILWGERRGLESADIHGVYLKILHKGRNPHPFLIPAYLQETQKLNDRLNTLFRK